MWTLLTTHIIDKQARLTIQRTAINEQHLINRLLSLSSRVYQLDIEFFFLYKLSHIEYSNILNDGSSSTTTSF